MNIVLVGFMGTGKSAVGKLLAKKLDWQFIDVDQTIEQEVGMSISALFAQSGEPYFRDLETKAIQLVSLLEKAVISCGGGAVLRVENMEELERNGVVVCLTATPEKIYERIKHNTDRPLLAGKNPLPKIVELLKSREHYYKRCHITIDTTHLPVEEVVSLLLTEPLIASKIK